MATKQISDFAPITGVSDEYVLHIHTGTNNKIAISDFFTAISDEIIIDGTLAQKGVVQLTDSVASTSTTTAATPNSVKQAYDLANLAVPITTSIFAGNGLTGGGDLSVDVTVELGTPSTLDNTTTNTATAISHTHQVNFPVTSVNGETGDVILDAADISGLGTVATEALVSGDGDTTTTAIPNISWINANVPTNASQLYRGRWEDQTGDASPPYWVDYGGSNNYILQSENFASGTWIDFGTILSRTDSGVATPTIDGQSFGNYWKVIPTTANSAHNILQGISPSNGTDISILLRNGGYNFVSIRIDTTGDIELFNCWMDLTTGATTVTNGASNFDIEAVDYGTGDWLVTARSTTGTLVGRVVFQPREVGNTSAFAGNGTDGILITRAQISEPNSRYVETTTTPVAYTPPSIYELKQYQSDVTAVAPGTDATVWDTVGSGGSGGGIVAAAPQVYTSDDEDGSGNIAITLDWSDNTTWWTLDFDSTPLITTSGSIQLTIENLPDTGDFVEIRHIKFVRAGRKNVTFTLPVGVSESRIDTAVYQSGAGDVDWYELRYESHEPDKIFFSRVDART